MDLRLLIVLVGLVLVVYVAWDSFRRRARNQYSFKLEKNLPPDLPVVKVNERDGFDETGVGRTRVVAQFDDDAPAHCEPTFDDATGGAVPSVTQREICRENLDLFADESVGAARLSATEPSHRRNVSANKAARTLASNEMQIIALTVLGRNGRHFAGSDLNRCFMEHDLRFGEHKVFHRYADASGQGTVLFSVANALNPGTFDPERMDQFNTPGISLFMTLPGRFDPAAAYRAMVELAQMLAKELNGDVLDGQRKPLSEETRLQHQQLLQRYNDWA